MPHSTPSTLARHALIILDDLDLSRTTHRGDIERMSWLPTRYAPPTCSRNFSYVDEDASQSNPRADFRWSPAEEDWLLKRVIQDNGDAKRTDKYPQWRKSLFHDFKLAFPCDPRQKSDGTLENQDELMQRWNKNQTVCMSPPYNCLIGRSLAYALLARYSMAWKSLRRYHNPPFPTATSDIA